MHHHQQPRTQHHHHHHLVNKSLEREEDLYVEDVFAGELDLDGADVLADAAVVLPDALPAGVDLLRVDAVLGVEVLHLAVGEDAVELVVDLVLGAQPGPQGEALLLARELEEVGPLAHDGGAARGHLEHLLFGRGPRDDVELLHLRLAQQPAGAAAEDGGGSVGVELRRDESLGCLLGRGLLGGGGAERRRAAGGGRERELRGAGLRRRPGRRQEVARRGGGLRGHGHVCSLVSASASETGEGAAVTEAMSSVRAGSTGRHN